MSRRYGRISKGNESGFTMLEVLVSVGLMGIVIIPLMGLLASAAVLHAQREQETRAIFLAQKKIEEIKNNATTDFAADYNKSPGAGTDFPSPDSKYKYTVIDSEGSDIKDITVQVWYDDDDDNVLNGDEQESTLKTKVARR